MAKTYFFWDDLEDNIVEEYDEAGSTVADYTTEPDHFGNVISQRRDGQSSFFHYDALGSTLAVTDESQNITDTRAYSAFGETIEQSGSTTIPYQYVGQKGYYMDDVTGQYIVRRRSYAPKRIRWLSTDPLITILSLRLRPYIYSKNSPLHYIDPSGEIPRCSGKWWRPSLLGGCIYRTQDPNPDFSMPSVKERGCTPPAVADWGDWSFESACDAHDECWQTCGKAQSTCDDNYLTNMRSECKKLPPMSESRNCCELVALVYYYYVESLGIPIYQYSQDISCAWKPCCCPLFDCEEGDTIPCQTAVEGSEPFAQPEMRLQAGQVGDFTTQIYIWPFTLIPDACRRFALPHP